MGPHPSLSGNRSSMTDHGVSGHSRALTESCSAILNTSLQYGHILQVEHEKLKKQLDKAHHDVERLRRALDRAESEKHEQQDKAASAVKTAEVCQLSAGQC